MSIRPGGGVNACPHPTPITLDVGTVYGYESHEKQAIFVTILWANGNNTTASCDDH
jgi:hypothetical protein